MKTVKIIFLTIFLALKFTILNAGIINPVYKQFIDSNLNGANNAPSPTTIKLTPDGKKVFIGSHSDTLIYIYDLSTPFDISTLDPSARSTVEFNGLGDDLWDGGNKSIEFNNDGTKIFILVENGLMQAHNLPSPYDVASISASTIIADDGIRWNTDYPITNTKDLAFNNDGTKMYINDGQHNSDDITEFNLSTPFDPSTVSSTYNLNTSSLTARYTMEMSFDDDGTRLYLSESGTSAAVNYIYVWKLSEPFSISSATYINKWPVTGNENNMSPYGWTFANDGNKLYITTEDASSDGDDIIYEYDLTCPYGIVICENETTSIVGAQIEIAKNVIHHNSSTIFKRFEWLRRNDNRNNLNSHNIKLDINNPILASLKNRLQTSLKDIKYTQASLKKENSSNNKRNWSYWSHVDISFGRVGENNFIKPKEIRAKGIMIGADKLINKKIFGLALRYGNDDIEIKSSTDAKLKSQALTLNIYGNLPLNEKSNLNALLGASLLSIEQLLSETVTGKRYGKQIFASMSYEDENNYTKYDLIPYGKIEMGITQFSDYTDFGTSSTNDVETHDKFDFKSGNASAGFKFDSILYMNDRQLSRNGFLEYVADLTPDIDHRYKNHADNVTVTNTIKKHSLHNIKGNIGFEFIKRDGYTIGINYERFQSLSRGGHSDSLLFKFGKKQIHNANFDVIYEPLKNNKTEISYLKNLNGFDVKFSSNYSLMSKIPDYGANLEVSGTF